MAPFLHVIASYCTPIGYVSMGSMGPYVVFLEPVGDQRRTVPHFKSLMNLIGNCQAQGSGGTFFLRYALLKKAILHLNQRSSGYFDVSL